MLAFATIMPVEELALEVTSADSCTFKKVHSIFFFHAYLEKLSVLLAGVSNKQMETAVVESDYYMTLPNRNDWIIVIVTAIINSTRFYVQLPLGCKSPISSLSLKDHDQGTGMSSCTH